MEKICGRAYENVYGYPEKLDDFKEHLKTCDVCNQLLDNLARQSASDFLSKLLGI